MSRPTIALLMLTVLALTAAPCGPAHGQTGPPRAMLRFVQATADDGLGFGFPRDPSPESETAADDEADADSPSAEELPAPSGAAKVPTAEEASLLVSGNAAENPWLPICEDEPSGWLPELSIPQELLDCTCDGQLPGEECRVWRSFHRPTHPDIDQDCVVCVKEPCLGYRKVCHTVDAVVQKCFEHQDPFCEKACEDGRRIVKEGTKTVRQLHPCKAQVKLFYWKPVVQYRDVYYYLSCGQACHEDDRAVVQRSDRSRTRS